jgi:hypothetical protein
MFTLFFQNPSDESQNKFVNEKHVSFQTSDILPETSTATFLSLLGMLGQATPACTVS